MTVTVFESLKQRLLTLWLVLRLYLRRCQHDQIGMVGGYLAYISLLSLVPLLGVAFSVLKAFPVFASLREQLESFLYANFIPSKGEELQNYINGFIDNIGQMTTVSILVLVFVALMLLHNIDKTLNKIWRVRKRPRLIISLSIYWMILTLGPILLGVSIALTSYIVTLTHMADNYTAGLTSHLLELAPYGVSLLAFFMLYQLVPNIKVRIRDAFWGALLAAILFEMLKTGFATYITHFPTYQAIYGALALVPILFVWIHLCWLVVLLGAELTACLHEHHQQRVLHEQNRVLQQESTDVAS
ncbi:MAG TPA: virulence factor BrkB family protein [Rheinheimera sp.]|nr:virulence factor BrkB family protein [Rheinheimera sp.]